MTAQSLKDTPLEKRSKILEAARKRFMHYGVAKTTMHDLADDIDMAVGSIYLHFKNKEEIVLAIAEACRDEQTRLVDSLLAETDKTTSEKLELFFVAKYRYLTEFRTETPHGKELIEHLLKHYPHRLAEWEQHFENAIIQILEQDNSLGFTDIPESAKMLRLATAMFFLPVYIELPRYPEEIELLRLVRWILKNNRECTP